MQNADIIKYLDRLEMALVPLHLKNHADVVKETESHLISRGVKQSESCPLDAFGPAHVYATKFHRRKHPEALGFTDSLRVLLALSSGSTQAVILSSLLMAAALFGIVCVLLIAADLAAPGVTGLWVEAATGRVWPGFYFEDTDIVARDVAGWMLIPCAAIGLCISAASIYVGLKASPKILDGTILDQS